MKHLIVENLSCSELESMLTKIVRKCLLELQPEKIPPKKLPKKLANIGEIASLLGKTPATIHNYKRKGLIPYCKIGRSLCFDVDQVLSSIKNFSSTNIKNANYE
jgi:hypothetical protein